MKDESQVVISVLDPAIDTESMTVDEMMKYAETRDVSKIRIKAGAKPTRYHTREIRHDVMESYVMAAGTDAERYRRAFLCGVVKVENLLQRDGSILPDWTPTNIGKLAAMPDADAERFSAAERQEIGLVVFDRSFLAPRTVLAYRLPPTLPRFLGEREFRRADAIPQSPATSNEEASQAQAG